MRIKGETVEEMCGFLDAAGAWRFPATRRPMVVLPSYNGARKLPVLTPSLALLVAREGLPVLLHGMRTEARRVLAADVLQALGIPALQAPDAVADGNGQYRHGTPAPRPGTTAGGARGHQAAHAGAQPGQAAGALPADRRC